jgi:hypothetical protein
MKSFKNKMLILVLILVGLAGVAQMIRAGSQGTLVHPDSTLGGGLGTSNICGILSLNCAEINSNNSFPVELAYATTSRTMNSVNDELILPTGGRTNAGFSLTSAGQETLTITPYKSLDGGLSWEALHLIRPSTLVGSLTAVIAGASPSGTWDIGPIGAATHVKVKATSLTAGTSVVVNLSAAFGTSFSYSTTNIPLQ